MQLKQLIILSLVAALCGVHGLWSGWSIAQSQVVGGLHDEKPADEHINRVLSSVQGDIQSRYPREYVSITPLSYRTQVVAGMNYFIKAIVTEKSGNKSHAHLRIYKPFRGPNELTAIKTDVDQNQPLKYFQ